MSDDRIARLTELARRVWPDCSDVEVVSGPKGLMVAGDDPELARITLLHINHRNAPVPLLEALEAALLVLAGDDTRAELAQLREQVKNVLKAELQRRQDQPPAWVEKLASEWEQSVASYKPSSPGLPRTVRQCAAELRKAAQSDKP